MKKERINRELRRKLLHSFFGTVLILILFYFDRVALAMFLGLLLLFVSIMIMLRLKGRQIPISDWFIETFERENVRFPGYGAFWYVLGTLLLALFLNDANEIAAAILTLAIGDSASTIFGIRGVSPLPYNKCKTMEGSFAFIIFSFSSCIFVGWWGLPLAFLTAVVESLPLPLDDNLLIPISCILYFIVV